MKANPYHQYKLTQVQTATQDRLLIMLLEGAIRFSNQGRVYITEKNYVKANESLKRAQDIVDELISSLNFEVGDIAVNLYKLYDYLKMTLIEANIKKDPARIDNALRLFNEIKKMWEEVVKKSKEQNMKPHNGGINV
ncbi:MAG: flagellar export chaperone FliS [Firmicutes bacterium]|nr:flagellar export chaperone FliS [Bacillota bacterium]